MIVFDHNLPRDQVGQLRRWRIRGVHIGFEIGRPEWLDQDEVIRYLHRYKRSTLFTRDLGFFHKRRCHRNHSIVIVTGSARQRRDDSSLPPPSAFRYRCPACRSRLQAHAERYCLVRTWSATATIRSLGLARKPAPRGHQGQRDSPRRNLPLGRNDHDALHAPSSMTTAVWPARRIGSDGGGALKVLTRSARRVNTPWNDIKEECPTG